MSRLRKLQPKQKLSYNVLLSTIRLSYLFVLRARLYPISHVTMLASIPFAPRIPHSPLPNTQAMLLIGIYALPCIHCVKTAASVCKPNCIDYHGHTAACSSLTRLFVPLTNSYACHVHTCSTSDQGVPLFLIMGHRQMCHFWRLPGMGKVVSFHELSRQNSDTRQSSLVKRQRV